MYVGACSQSRTDTAKTSCNSERAVRYGTQSSFAKIDDRHPKRFRIYHLETISIATTMKTAASSSPPSPSAPPSKRQNTAEEKSEAVNSGLKVFFDQNQLALQKNIEEREAALKLGEQQLEEAKKAAPALFAKPGDQFTFHVTYCDFDATLNMSGETRLLPRKRILVGIIIIKVQILGGSSFVM